MNLVSPIADPITGARLASEDRRNAQVKNAGALAMESIEKSAEDEQLWKAAEGFEQIFLYSMMKQMRNTTFMSEDSLDSSNASQIYTSMLDEQISQIASKDRRFGISKMIHDSLAKNLANTNFGQEAKSSIFRQISDSALAQKGNSNKEEIG